MFSNNWQRAGPLNTSRQQLGVGVINGSLYAVGGSNGCSRLNSVERYDRELDRWSYAKPLNTSRSGVGVGTLGDALYALGGYDEHVLRLWNDLILKSIAGVVLHHLM